MVIIYQYLLYIHIVFLTHMYMQPPPTHPHICMHTTHTRIQSACITSMFACMYAYTYRMKMNAYHFLMMRKNFPYLMIMASTNQPFYHQNYHYHQGKKVRVYTLIQRYIHTYIHHSHMYVHPTHTQCL